MTEGPGRWGRGGAGLQGPEAKAVPRLHLGFKICLESGHQRDKSSSEGTGWVWGCGSWVRQANPHPHPSGKDSVSKGPSLRSGAPPAQRADRSVEVAAGDV